MTHRRLGFRRRLLLVGGLFVAVVAAVAPVQCSLGSGDEQATCTTVFGYRSPLR